MKKSILFVFVVALVFACNKDDVSYDNYWKSLGIYEKTGDGVNDFQISLDNGNTIIPVEITESFPRYDDGERVIAYYSELSVVNDSAGKKIINTAVHHVDDILTKGVITLTDDIADSIGNNSIHVHEEDIWISRNYLNIYFSYYGGGEVHYINMIRYPNDSLDNEGRLILEFRHNNNEDYYNYALDGIVSFDMNSLRETGVDSLPIVVKVDDYYDGIITWKDTYYFNQNSESLKSVKIENPGALIE